MYRGKEIVCARIIKRFRDINRLYFKTESRGTATYDVCYCDRRLGFPRAIIRFTKEARNREYHPIPGGIQSTMDYEARKANLKETRDCLNFRDF